MDLGFLLIVFEVVVDFVFGYDVIGFGGLGFDFFLELLYCGVDCLVDGVLVVVLDFLS